MTPEATDITDGTSDNTIHFALTNTHEEMGTEVTISGNKAMMSTTGVDKDLSGFTFNLYEKDKDGGYIPVKGVGSVTSNENGKFGFSTIRYTEDQRGDYTYWIKEEPETGFVCDVDENGAERSEADKYHPVYVKVAYGKDNKSLVATVSTVNAPVVITNKYEAEGKISFNITKSMRENGSWPAGAEFRIRVTDSVKDKELADEVKPAKYVILNEKQPGGKVTFDGYTKATEHVYTIEEVDGNGNVLSGKTVNNIAYGKVDTVTVTFTDDRSKTANVLDAVVDGKTETELPVRVSNGYTAAGDFAPKVEKVLTGKELEKDEFSFELRNAEGTVLQTVSNGNRGTDGEAIREAVFDKIEYKLADLGGNKEKAYTYYITEVSGNNAGMKYDIGGQTYNVSGNNIKGHKITFTLYDDGKGNLVKKDTTGLEAGVLTIKNEYSAEGEVQLIAKKSVKTASGNVIPYANVKRTFEFKITQTEPEGKIKTVDGETKDFITAETNASGLATFTDKIKYEQAGIYKYNITEVAPEGATTIEGKTVKDGIIYDTGVHEIVVEVTDDGNGKLVSTPTYENNAGYASFVNTYGAIGCIDISAAKLYDYTYPSGGFKFFLTPDENDREGNKAIDGIKVIEKEGDLATWHFDYSAQDLFEGDDYKGVDGKTYTYYIYEKDESLDNSQINYKGAEKYAKVTITVKDLNNDGKLDVSKVIDYKDVPSQEKQSWLAVIFGEESPVTADAYFRNYVKRTGSLQFDAVKLLQYIDGALVQPTERVQEQMKKLRFEVTENGEKVIPDGQIQIAVNDDKTVNTSIVFETIHYDAPGEHEYVIKETVPTDSFDFDIDKEWMTGKKFKVSVTDPEKIDAGNYGKLEVNWLGGDKVYSIADNKIKFEVYNPWTSKIKITKRFLGVDAGHPINGGVTLRLVKRTVLGFEQAAIPDGAAEDEASWVVKTADESRTFTALSPGTYRLYESVADDCAFTNEKVIKNGGYVEFEINDDGCIVSDDNKTPRTEYVLDNRAENTVGLYFKLIKNWKGKIKAQGDTYPHVDVTITRTKQPEDMTAGDKPEVFTETIITRTGEVSAEHITGTYPAQYWSDKDGKYKDYIYKVEEVPVPGYVAYEGTIDGTKYAGVSGNRALGSTTGKDISEVISFLNIVEQKDIDIPVNKVWKDGKSVATHPTLTFHLLADGKDTGKTIELPAGQLTAKFTGLKVYDDFDKKDYHEIEYTVTEDPVAGYKKGEGVQNADGSWTFTNESIKADIIKYDANDEKATPS